MIELQDPQAAVYSLRSLDALAAVRVLIPIGRQRRKPTLMAGSLPPATALRAQSEQEQSSLSSTDTRTGD